MKIVKISVVGIIFLVLICYILYLSHEIKKATNVSAKLHKELIEKNQLVKEDSVTYSKIINDLFTEKNLSKVLKEENKSLANKVKKYEVLYYATVSTSKVEKKDTFSLSQRVTVTPGDSVIKVYDYFPTKVNPFVEYYAEINKGTVASKFTINPIKVDFTIVKDGSETQRVVFNTPSWLNIESVDIKSSVSYMESHKQTWEVSVGTGFLYTDRIRPYGMVGIGKGKLMYDVIIGENIYGGGIRLKIF